MSAVKCPKCETVLPAELTTVDVAVCQCEAFVYIRPFGEWFVRWAAIEAFAESVTKADPKLHAETAQRVASAKRASEN